jgi:hypothetical protein
LIPGQHVSTPTALTEGFKLAFWVGVGFAAIAVFLGLTVLRGGSSASSRNLDRASRRQPMSRLPPETRLTGVVSSPAGKACRLGLAKERRVPVVSRQ